MQGVEALARRTLSARRLPPAPIAPETAMTPAPDAVAPVSLDVAFGLIEGMLEKKAARKLSYSSASLRFNGAFQAAERRALEEELSAQRPDLLENFDRLLFTGPGGEVLSADSVLEPGQEVAVHVKVEGGSGAALARRKAAVGRLLNPLQRQDPSRLPSGVKLISNLNALRGLAAVREVPVKAQSQEEIRLALWSLFTGTVSLESDADKVRIINALRAEPALLVRAATDISRDGTYSSFDTHWDVIQLRMTETLRLLASPENKKDVDAWVAQTIVHTDSLNPMPGNVALNNPGLAYVEGRGAEKDLTLLARVAQLTRSEKGATYMTINGDFNDVLKAAQADADGRLLAKELRAAVKAGRLKVVTVTGSDPADPVAVVAQADGTDASVAEKRLAGGVLVLAANPLLVDMRRLTRIVEFLIQTLNGRTLSVTGDIHELIQMDQKIQQFA
jgi:hypothetical protein